MEILQRNMTDPGKQSALAEVERHYSDYGGHARDLSKQGYRFIGYFCAYVPLEIISAAGFIPFRIKGNVNEPITVADTQMENIVCPMVRSCFDKSLKGSWDFIEGLVIPHSCDSMCITHDIWRTNLNLPYFHVLNLPHTISAKSHDFFVNSLRTFCVSLERYSGRPIDSSVIGEHIARYNTFRKIVRSLYDVRRQDGLLIPGSTMVRVLMAAMSLPVEEATLLVNNVLNEVSGSRNPPNGKVPRIMIVSSEQDDDGLARIVEECGGEVVADFTCPGFREFGTDVEPSDEPLDALARRYLGLYCARTYRYSTGNQMDDLEARFGPVGRLISKFLVKGVILRVHRSCDPYGLEVPSLRTYLLHQNVAVLYIEDDYSIRDRERLRTRIQAFIELMDSKS